MRRLILCAVVVLCWAGQAEGAIVTADVAVHSPGGQYGPLATGTTRAINYDQYSWYDIPEFAQDGGYLIWQYEATGFPNIPDGLSTIEVLTDGPVLLACRAPWGGLGGPGEWNDEQISYEDFLADGWSEFATGLTIIQEGWSEPNHDYIVYQRDCVAGDVFTYRVEKYHPPMVIRSVETNVVPEPTSILVWSLIGLTFGGVGWWRRKRVA